MVSNLRELILRYQTEWVVAGCVLLLFAANEMRPAAQELPLPWIARGAVLGFAALAAGLALFGRADWEWRLFWLAICGSLLLDPPKGIAGSNLLIGRVAAGASDVLGAVCAFRLSSTTRAKSDANKLNGPPGGAGCV